MRQSGEFLLRSYIRHQLQSLREATEQDVEEKEQGTKFLTKIKDPFKQTTQDDNKLDDKKGESKDDTSDVAKITKGNKASEKVKKKFIEQKPVRPEDFENVGKTRIATADVLNFVSDQMKGKSTSNVQALGDVLKVQKQNLQGSTKSTTDAEATKGTTGTKLF
jgi:hypothetical protein